mgnify:CR=1 FL=1
MPVFDFSGASDKKPGVQSECTYTTFQSNEQETSPEKPIMVLDNSSRQWKHHPAVFLQTRSNVLPLSLKRTMELSQQIFSALIQDS